jgi:folate-dependent phosphoribosylglycinamide formyltransferase PurN
MIVYGINMSTKEQIQKLEEIGFRIWEKHTPFQVQERLRAIWDDVADNAGLNSGFEPLYPIIDKDFKLSCSILGSGGFSTGREELVKAKVLKARLGWAPIQYSAIITNRDRSNAKAVAEEFGIPALSIDYTNWRSENQITGSTKLFGFAPGSEPEKDELEQRIRIKKSFDKELHDAILENLGEMPGSISLRGYDFILTDQLFSTNTEVDNTHPASLIIKEPNGEPAYAGWQESAYNKMKEDGITSFPTSLIRVGYIGNYDDLIEVDAGELLAISPGNPGQYDKIEDHFLLTLKAVGLLPYFWGLSKDDEEVEYLTKDGDAVIVRQRLVIVGDRIMSGRQVFGQHENELEIFSNLLNDSFNSLKT